ncbi:MAG: ADP-ribosylation factor family protein [Candidatus Hodarchaeota archaeon]
MEVENSLQISPEKRIPIALVGLENAGKTSLIVRLQTGEFQPTLPTSGLDTEIIEIKGHLFQLFDLGGHQRFRQLFWKNYVQLSQGIVFVIDSNDIEKLDEVVEWLWKCLEWNLNTPFLILANKSDLNHIPLDDLIEKIKLNHLPRLNPQRSFQIFEVSIKLGTNLDQALFWFSQKITNVVLEQRIRLIGLYLYLPTGIPIATHIFTEGTVEGFDSDMIPGFLNAIDNFTSGVMGPNEGLQSLYTENQCIVMVKRDGLLCAAVTAKDSDPALTRMVAESVLNYLEASFSEKISHFRKDGKIRFPKNFVLDYLVQNFSDNINFGYLE